MPAPRTHVPTVPRPYIPRPSKQDHADPRSVTQTKDTDRGQPGKVPAVALDPAKGMGPKTDRQRSQALVRGTTRPVSVQDFPIAGSAEHTERVQWTGGREARARRTPRSRRAWEREGPLSARPPPVCWVGPMRSDRGRSFVVEPQPPGASCPRPCPPPPALGRSQGAPRGLLKRPRGQGWSGWAGVCGCVPRVVGRKAGVCVCPRGLCVCHSPPRGFVYT